MIIFRVVSDEERSDLETTGYFRAGPNASEEGKWFATSLNDAIDWGLCFERSGLRRHRVIVSVELSAADASGAFRIDDLDGIGPAIFVANEVLNRLSFRIAAR